MQRSCLGLTIGFIFVLLLLLIPNGLGVVVQVPFTLGFGWISYLKNTLPKVQPDWAAISLAATALGMLAGGIQVCGSRWIRRSGSMAMELPANDSSE